MMARWKETIYRLGLGPWSDKLSSRIQPWFTLQKKMHSVNVFELKIFCAIICRKLSSTDIQNFYQYTLRHWWDPGLSLTFKMQNCACQKKYESLGNAGTKKLFSNRSSPFVIDKDQRREFYQCLNLFRQSWFKNNLWSLNTYFIFFNKI